MEEIPTHSYRRGLKEEARKLERDRPEERDRERERMRERTRKITRKKKELQTTEKKKDN